MLISRLDAIVCGKHSCTVSHVCSIQWGWPTVGRSACWFDARGVNGGAGPMTSREASSRVPQFKGGNRMESSAAKQQASAGGGMITAEQKYLRTELEQRRERLHTAVHSPAADASLSQLLTAVDAALGRIDQGTFGLCETCHDSVEPELLPDNSRLWS